MKDWKKFFSSLMDFLFLTIKVGHFILIVLIVVWSTAIYYIIQLFKNLS